MRMPRWILRVEHRTVRLGGGRNAIGNRKMSRSRFRLALVGIILRAAHALYALNRAIVPHNLLIFKSVQSIEGTCTYMQIE